MASKKYICQLSQELQDRARKELNEDPERREEDIETLRHWMLRQPHLIGDTEDKSILQFLRNCKFSLESAKKRTDNFYTMLMVYPELFSDLDPLRTELQEIMKLGRIISLGYDQDGRRIGLLRFGSVDYSKYTVDDIQRVEFLYAWYILQDEQTQICGTTTIFDFGGVTTAFLIAHTPSNLKRVSDCFQNGVPLRYGQLIVWNSSPFFDIVFSIIKVFTKPKLLQRLWKADSGATFQDLHSQIPREYLPTEYGGTAGDLQHFIDKTVAGITSCRDVILKLPNYYVDETKRPGGPRIEANGLGIDGSFRKLTID